MKPSIELRNARSSDHAFVISVLDDWWGGRHMADMLPRLFFEHFQDTTYVAEDGGRVVGFLVGFISQSKPKEAYIHFVGVDPEVRGHGIGRLLYERFFRDVAERGCRLVRAVTAPVNTGSIAFHTEMGFDIEPGDESGGEVSVAAAYDGPGQDRVRFVRALDGTRADRW